MREKHRTQATKTTALFPASAITTWMEEIKEWQADHTKSDPYAEPEYSKFVLCSFIPQANIRFKPQLKLWFDR